MFQGDLIRKLFQVAPSDESDGAKGIGSSHLAQVFDKTDLQEKKQPRRTVSTEHKRMVSSKHRIQPAGQIFAPAVVAD